MNHLTINEAKVWKVMRADPHISFVCMEECGELIQAISKVERYGATKDHTDSLVEEIADVCIILEMLITRYNLKTSDIQRLIDYKQNRAMNRFHLQ